MRHPLGLLIKSALGAGCLLVGLQACAPAPQALRPVVAQNQKNLEFLAANVQVLLTLYEPLLQASGEALVTQYIGKAHQEMIAVLGPPSLPPPDLPWDKLFEQADESPLPKQEAYLQRYQFVHAAAARGVSGEDLQSLTQREGWIYTAAVDPAFTPHKAHELLQSLAEARRGAAGDDAAYYARAEALLLPYEPTLRRHRETLAAARELLAGLREELGKELQLAVAHSQQLQNYVDSTTDVERSLQNIDNTQLIEVLGFLGNRYIKNPARRSAAIELLTAGLAK